MSPDPLCAVCEPDWACCRHRGLSLAVVIELAIRRAAGGGDWLWAVDFCCRIYADPQCRVSMSASMMRDELTSLVRRGVFETSRDGSRWRVK